MVGCGIVGAVTPGVYYAFENSDGVGKAIVLLLVVGSVATWTLMLDKGLALRRAGRLSRRFLVRFRANSGNIANSSLARDAKRDPGPLGTIYCAGVDKLIELYE